jgi:hypothetical protein
MPITPALQRFTPITLAEMDAVRLQFRVDTKYLFGTWRMPALLEELLPEYRLLEVDGQRGIAYETRYFDTAGLTHYFDHHNGRILRGKVRVRRYGGSGLCVLEAKCKTGRGDTDKRRIVLDGFPERLTTEQQAFANLHTRTTDPLMPVLENKFRRLTFVHRQRLERLTIDTDIAFAWQEHRVALTGLAVAEIKEERAGHGSPFKAVMHRWGVHPASFSKYCIGMALVRPSLKQNTFKAVITRARQAIIPLEV